MIGIELEPVDTLFFRDGTPSAADSASQDEIGGVFPPHPASVAGSLRACLAMCNGWSGRGRWPAELDSVLGTGSDLGKLVFDGPYILVDGDPLYPVPSHMLGSTDSSQPLDPPVPLSWTPQAFLRPGPEVVCDLGDAVRLPKAPSLETDHSEPLEPAVSTWLTGRGLAAVLREELPAKADLRDSGGLWREESRVGIKRDPKTRSAEEGALYSARHVRLAPAVTIGMRVDGLPPTWRQPCGELVALGGEGRIVTCRLWHGGSTLDMPLAAIEATRRMTVTALTPLDVDGVVYHGGGALDTFGGATVVSACMRRAQRIGGWRSFPSPGPLPLRGVLAPGSTLFCEVTHPERLREIVEASGGRPRVGSHQEWGFGAVALGIWSDNSEVTH
jgi:CRISPR-associated protein Cmr3